MTSNPLLLQVGADLWRHEGYRKYAYPDPLTLLARKYKNYKWGFKPAREILTLIGQPETAGRPWTVGVGETLGVNCDSTMTEEQARRRLDSRIIEFAGQLDRIYPLWKTRSFETQTVLLNLIYNMGPKGLSKFTNTLKFITAEDYEAAADNLERSLWYKQVGSRARELVDRLRNQEIPDQYLVA